MFSSDTKPILHKLEHMSTEMLISKTSQGRS